MEGDVFFVSPGAKTLLFETLRPNIPLQFEAVFEVPKNSIIKQVGVGEQSKAVQQ